MGRSQNGHCWFGLLMLLVEGSTGVAAFSGFDDGCNNIHHGLRLADHDSFRERFIPLGNETTGTASDVSQSGTAAIVLHVDDGSSGNGPHRSVRFRTDNGFRAGVHISNRSAEDGGCVENQGGEEESLG